jgi:hypothetical protein
MSKKQPSLESLLKKLSTQPVQNDPKRRSRIELLAIRMWKMALNGDQTSQKLLLDRLQTAQPEVPVSSPIAGTGTKSDPYADTITILKFLVERGVLAPEAFHPSSPRALMS